MRWTPGNRGNIQDMRGRIGGRAMPLGIGGFVVLLLLSWATGTDFLSLFTQGSPSRDRRDLRRSRPRRPPKSRWSISSTPSTTDAQGTWSELLGSRYQRTQVVLFRDAIQSACGSAESATGPFYCPGDRRSISISGSSTSSRSASARPAISRRPTSSPTRSATTCRTCSVWASASVAAGPNSASVAIELQADCFAGVWGHAAAADGRFQAGRVELEPGDVEEALQAAAAIGDDRLQKMATGRVMPDRFTHGTSAQRVEWFKRGMDTGDPRACDPARGDASVNLVI